MTAEPRTEAALLLVVPEAEPAVARHRARHDRAARVGVPAHVTVAYPFKTPLDEQDLEVLTRLCRSTPALALRFSRTGWFGQDVLFLEPDDPAPIVSLVRRIEEAFPEHPIYGGVHEDLRPHLTVGQGVDRDALRAAEQEVLPHLPVRRVVTELQLWQGPPLATGVPGWNRVRSLPFGP